MLLSRTVVLRWWPLPPVKLRTQERTFPRQYDAFFGVSCSFTCLDLSPSACWSLTMIQICSMEALMLHHLLGSLPSKMLASRFWTALLTWSFLPPPPHPATPSCTSALATSTLWRRTAKPRDSFSHAQRRACPTSACSSPLLFRSLPISVVALEEL